MINIKVLACNNVAFPFVPGNISDVLGEHGLAFLLDNGEEKILYDTGKGRTLLTNLEQWEINPEEIDKVIISHGHLDHTGGLLSLVKSRTAPTRIFCSPKIFEHKNMKDKSTQNFEYIGSPFSREELESEGAKFQFVENFTPVGKNIWLSGEIPRRHSWERDVDNFYKREGENNYVKEDLEDDQSVVIDTDAGLVILAGCGHAGIINILSHVCGKMGEKKLHIIGGLHLAGVSESRLEATINRLKEYPLANLITGHCTGFEATCRLRGELGEKLKPLGVGEQYNF